MRKPLFFLLATAISACSAAVIPPIANFVIPHPPIDDNYPLPHNSSLVAHDPNIIKEGDYYYLFKGGIHIPFYRSKSLDGPWEDVGTVLDGPSVIDLKNRNRPWAPSVIKKDGTYYCYYALSQTGITRSAIGVATSKELKPGTWKDHGALLKTGEGVMERIFKGIAGIDGANAIDPSLFKDPKNDGRWYLNYGSFFSGIWQVPLTDDMLHMDYSEKPEPKHLQRGLDHEDSGEGSFMTYREPYYYLWFSRGNCCHFPGGKPVKAGHEYSIHVGRSLKPDGDFKDKWGTKLTDGGGHEVYGTNHNGKAYAPGGIGVLTGEGKDGGDILYYHFLNLSVSLKFEQAYMGWSYLEYDKDGWPVVSKDQSLAPKDKPEHAPTEKPKPEPSTVTVTASRTKSSSGGDKPTKTPDTKPSPPPNKDHEPTSKDPPKPTNSTSTKDDSKPKPTDQPDPSQSPDGENKPTPEVTPAPSSKVPNPTTAKQPPSSTESQPPKQDPPKQDPPPSEKPTPTPQPNPQPQPDPKPQSTTFIIWVKIVIEIFYKKVFVTSTPTPQ